ncbi:hypothetical protein OsI_29869 [Oryza sativa Indica Group]|uniref:Sulfotransferase n=2 Tax=Oryza sativa TaxID=4530 RepID=B9G1S2_ORYSJ|nr:hypothetical protein OsI_29869 [Oryza sativa Indica Group]EEE68989.1 hypothetical protein OsJ_27922 [Oryza sativa Japonica Group]
MAQGQLDAESVVPTATGVRRRGRRFWLFRFRSCFLDRFRRRICLSLGCTANILASLPTREGWWTAFVLYHGCWMTQQAATSVSLPRWCTPSSRGAPTMCSSPPTQSAAPPGSRCSPSPSPTAAAAGDHPLLTQSPHDLVPFIEVPFHHLHPLAALDALPSPRLLSTHMPPQLLPRRVAELGCRIVYLCREPKDVVVSLWHYMNKYGPIWDHCLGYWKKSMEEPDMVLFLKYDDMMADPAGHVKKLAEFLRAPFTDEEVGAGVVEEVVRLCSFEKLSRLPVNSSGVVDRSSGRPMENSVFFRKGEVGDWKNYLTEEMAKKLDAVIEEKLKGSGLTF